MVISVGYRVNSKKGTQFRIWATQKLREFLLKGYVVNENRLREAHETRLKELQEAHKFLHQAVEAKRLEGYEKELASIINDYTQTWVTLSRYDEGDFKISAKTRATIKNLDYARAKQAVEHFKIRLVKAEYATGTFGHERGTLLSDLLRDVSRRKLGLAEKAAIIFYETIKNRPFVDGNKRIASLLFVVFLIENHFLYDSKGERKFNDNGLVALALLIEETKPSEKPTLLKLIANLVSKK
jgi:prophage maintenance system killer protein